MKTCIYKTTFYLRDKGQWAQVHASPDPTPLVATLGLDSRVCPVRDNIHYLH